METLDYIKFKLKCLKEMQQDPEIIGQERISAKIELCKELLAHSKSENLPISGVVATEGKLCGSFEPDNTTSSATICKHCGREKWHHPHN